MNNNISFSGFDSNGKPCDYIDENGTHWIYQGKTYYGYDDWSGNHISN